MDSQSPSRSHPVGAAAAAVEAAVKDVAEVDPVFMTTEEKKAALLALDRAGSRLEELRLRVLAAADDVAADEGARDVAAGWPTTPATTGARPAATCGWPEPWTRAGPACAGRWPRARSTGARPR
jgi:hypothetical protein